MKAWIGKSLMAIGLIHQIYGLVAYHKVVFQFAGELLFNTVGRSLDRRVAFWFFMTGFSLMIVGGLIDWIERRKLEMPLFLKWSFLAFTVIGCFMHPKSGLWALLIPAIGIFLRARKEAGKKEKQ
ncbi:MAG: DUF6463 family protein [Proteobacteria bacterium]|nr:DUF6463 family protein [Pseudomonadota bacterium]